ncbi:MAG: hypothetical protein KAG61_05555 [Bacteriovoracaceae bacterium]|nr:hypothetical protein [Bacteriovoracaceae bacterium]
MDLTVLKKKISSYRTPKGRITNLPDELLGEILFSWEQWTGASSLFYKELGADHRKMASLIGRAKRLKREGRFPEPEFTEIAIDEDVQALPAACGVSSGPGCNIELVWDNNKVIRFGTSDLLLDFLKKAA